MSNKQMKWVLPILLFITTICASCGLRRFERSDIPEDKFITKTIRNKQDSRIYGMPEGSRISILSTRDTTTNTDVSIVIPISGNSEFDKALHDTIQNLKNVFIDSASKTELTNYFEVSPETTYITTKIISYRFRFHEAYGGAAHGGSYYFSYNYDVEKKKQINFEDYFTINSEEDEITVINLIEKSFDKEGGNIGNLRNIDFNIESDTVSFNPGEIGSYVQGLYKARIDKYKINEYIRNDYR